ncbi:MAG: hypothetical protein ACTSWN_00165 [Promethearchaeota archaeon]
MIDFLKDSPKRRLRKRWIFVLKELERMISLREMYEAINSLSGVLEKAAENLEKR